MTPTLMQPVYSELFLTILKKRGLTDANSIRAFISPELSTLFDPYLMKGMREAVERIFLAVKNHEKILIHGDYDVDGVTGAAIISRILTILKADYSVFLPERDRDGYGVSSRAIQDGGAAGVKLLITVDCGVAAAEPIKLARNLGMDVIVIDHHRIPASGLPNANIILNPIQTDCPYPFKELSAAGLAFKLGQCLLGDAAFELLDLAAISTIGDVVPLILENRTIVKKGLEVIAAQKKVGISALLATSKIRTKKVTATQVAFMLAPRINAAGRMSSPDVALRLLVTESAKEALSLANIIESENEARKEIERRCTKEAVAWVERSVNFNRERVLVAASEKWHVGVIGIVAARLVEKFHRPAIVIGFQKGIGKGSARSIPGFNLVEAMQYAKETLMEFGGHAQAAGLSIDLNQINEFRKKINEFAEKNLDANQFKRNVDFDLELTLSELGENFFQELNLLEPHGAGNPHPKFFTRDLKMISNPPKEIFGNYEIVVSDGKSNRAMQLKEEDYRKIAGLPPQALFNAVYEIRQKSWNGVESIVLTAKKIDAE